MSVRAAAFPVAEDDGVLRLVRDDTKWRTITSTGYDKAAQDPLLLVGRPERLGQRQLDQDVVGGQPRGGYLLNASVRRVDRVAAEDPFACQHVRVLARRLSSRCGRRLGSIEH